MIHFGPMHPVTITRWIDQPSPAAVLPAIEAIFFAAAAREYTPGAEREAFRQLWLGQYLELDADKVWLALAPEGDVAGYLVGCFECPGGSPRFATLRYFSDFADAALKFPAHLHVNIDAGARGLGIGARLVDAFCAQARDAGLNGVHIVTGAGARNVGFYTRRGFAEQARTAWRGGEVVFLGRAAHEAPLTPSTAHS